jgi:hypothetical protein
MKASLPRRKAHPRMGQSRTRILVVGTCFVAVIVSGLMIGRSFVESSSLPAADDHLAIVQLAPDQLGRCATYELDNKSAIMKQRGYGPCRDISPATRPNSEPPETPSLPAHPSPEASTGTIGRMNGIGGYFKTR